MSHSLTTDIILQSVGKRVKNSQGNYLGQIVEVTRNASCNAIEYAILMSDQLFDQEVRFFAIPITSTRIKVTEAGEIILIAEKDELHLSNGILLSQCPSPDFHHKPIIFELYEYVSPKNRAIKN